MKDTLSTAKGILLGLLIVALFWALVIWMVTR
jgi:hypothetical protein